MCSIPCCIIMICLLGAVYANEDKCLCPCPQPPQWALTKPPEAEDCCHHDSRFRYKCIDGYVRQAGTSNLVQCKMTASGPQWSIPHLSCIPDPKKSEQPMRTTTEHEESTEIPQESLSYTTATTAHAHQTSATAPRQTTSAPTIPSSVSTERDSPRPITPQIKSVFQTVPPTQDFLSSPALTAPTTRSPHMPTSVPTEQNRTMPTTPSPLSNSQAQTKGPTIETEGADPTFRTSTSGSSPSPTETVSSDNNIPSSGRHGMDAVGPGLGTVGGILLVVSIALLWIGFQWQRNRSRSTDPQSTIEEQVAMSPMTNAPSGPAAS